MSRRFNLKWLSIKSKIILMLVGVSLVSISVITYLGYTNGKQALTDRIKAQLTSLRASRTYQIERYFERIRNEVITLSEDHMMIDAMREFKEAFHELREVEPDPDWEEEIFSFYRDLWLPKLARNIGTEQNPILESYIPRPEEVSSRYLQFHYTTGVNPNPLGQKMLLNRGTDTSRYGEVHELYHPILRNLVKRFGYYDLFFIDIESGFSVYSYSKEADFASNLASGPYSETKLGEAFQHVKQTLDRGFAYITDFGPHRATYDQPAAFLASPLYDGSECVGVLAIQISPDEIEKVMTGGRRWREDGLGETGESYLVGPDYLMRSTSRFLIDTGAKEEYLGQLRRVGVSESKVNRIRQLDTTILEQEVRTESVTKALDGEAGTQQIRDYRRVPVLSSFTPLEIEGLNWVLLAEMDRDEAMAPVREFSYKVLITSSVIMFVITLCAMGLAEYFVRPIRRLRNQAHSIRAGESSSLVEIESRDEVGDLAEAFNEMVKSLRTQAEVFESESRENERLLLRVLPPAVGQRLRRGETIIADHFDCVTVLFADLEGFTQLTRETTDAGAFVDLLDGLITSFDEATGRHGVEKFKTLGSTYVATSGFGTLRPDHARCTADFALEILLILRSFNLQHSSDFQLSIGIDSGPVVAGVVGRQGLVYDIWGDTVNLAHRLHQRADSNEILMLQHVYAQLKDVYPFEQVGEMEVPGGGRTAVWRLLVNEMEA